MGRLPSPWIRGHSLPAIFSRTFEGASSLGKIPCSSTTSRVGILNPIREKMNARTRGERRDKICGHGLSRRSFEGEISADELSCKYKNIFGKKKKCVL